uniref:Uncharacterized protein n=1 Tax=Lepeophtheirus salmonis TaxID=72036 RepID=A0A0K2V4W8_LEPSM
MQPVSPLVCMKLEIIDEYSLRQEA